MSRFETQLIRTETKSKAVISALAEIFGTLIVWVGSMVLIAKFFQVFLPNPHNPNFGEEIRFSFLLLFLSFGIPTIFLFLMRKYVSNAGILTLFNQFGNFRFAPLITGFAISAFILLTTMIIAEPKAFEMAKLRATSFSPNQFSIIMVVYFFSFFVQTMFEELFFRGAIVQHIARTGLPLFLTFILSAIIFAIFHIGPNIGYEVLIGVLIMGLSYNYATYRTQGIETAIGAHFANNLIVGAILGSLDNSQNFEHALVSGLIYAVAFVSLVELYVFISKKND